MNSSVAPRFPELPAPLIVLDAWDYTERLFLGGGTIPWLDANAFDAYYRQTIGLLRPSIVTLDLDRLIQAQLQRRPDLRDYMIHRPRTSYPLRTVLADDELAQALSRLIEVTEDARGRTPLLISMSSPLRLLQRLYRFAHGTETAAWSEDDAERAAVYLADFLGRAARTGCAGLLLVDKEGEASQPAYADSLSPLSNLSRHQRWSLLLATQAPVAEVDGVSAVFSPTAADVWVKAPFDGGLGQGLPASTSAIYAEVPVDAQPEAVLMGLQRVRALGG